MVKRRVKIGISFLLYVYDRVVEGVRRSLRLSLRPKAIVLYYHSIRDVDRASFRKQLDIALELSRPWKVGEISHGSTGTYFAITFDDGYASVVKNAVPELRKSGIPYTIFFPTGSLGGRPLWVNDAAHPFWREKVIGPDELRALSQDPLVTIGSHSVSHSKLSELQYSEAVAEIEQSKRDLELIIGKEVDSFSFPHGKYTIPLGESAKAIGYRRLFTIWPKISDPSRESLWVGRIAVEPTDGLWEFKLKLLGAFRWQAWYRQL